MTIHKTQVESISRAVEEPCSPDSDHAVVQPSMRSLLSWKKRKLSFRSPRARGEPLLNKAYGEEGGDDIDFDRRQLCTPVEPLPLMWSKNENGADRCGDFGDDHFAIGSWEQRDLVSRDGQMKLSAQVFSLQLIREVRELQERVHVLLWWLLSLTGCTITHILCPLNLSSIL